METQTAKETRREGALFLAVLAAFILSLTLLIVAIKLVQQNIGGFGPPLLLIFSVFGIISSLFLLITADGKQTPNPVAATLETVPTTQDLGHSKRLLEVLEVQTEALEREKAKLANEVLALRGEIQGLKTHVSDWEERSIEVFRMMNRVINSGANLDKNYVLALERTKKHFAQLVNPLGITVIEPQKGDPFDELSHQVVDEAGDENLPPWVITECVEWGYSINGQVDTPAKVVISREG